MYLDPHIHAAIAEQRTTERIAAAQHARELRLASQAGGRPLRLRLRRTLRLTGALTPPTPLPA